jgi:CRP-like cAMP-binding protein
LTVHSHLSRTVGRGAILFIPGERGPLWRVLEGAVSVEAGHGREAQPVQIAFAGDLLGPECLCDQPYQFTARAMTDCVLQSIHPQGERDLALWMRQVLWQQQRRCVDMAELRSGTVRARLAQLLGLLGCDWQAASTLTPAAWRAMRQALPSLGDLSGAIQAERETVCRALGQLLGREPAPRVPSATHGFAALTATA